MPAKSARSRSMRAIRRMVLARIAAVGVVVSVFAAAIVIWMEHDRISEETVSRAIYGTSLFNLSAMPLLDQPITNHQVFKAILANALANSRDDETGRLVYAAIESPAGKSIAEAGIASPEKQAIETAMAESPVGGPDNLPRAVHRILRIGGSPYIDVIAPLKNSLGEQVASLRMLIKVAPATISGVWQRVRRSVLYSILIVIAISAVLYPIITRLMDRLSGVSDDLLQSNLGTLEVLGSAIAKRDSDTDAHNYRATIYSVRLAEALNRPPGQIRDLIKGALLHDVGKIGVRDSILMKPGDLTPEEYAEMKRHVRDGVDIISRSDWLKSAADVVGCHHEKFDGSGYDKSLSGDNIPENARIFSIADVFDALTSKRPYKPAFDLKESLQILTRGRGTQFDPDILDVFLSIAPMLHEQTVGRDDETARADLQQIMTHYYREGIGTLM